MIEKMKSVTISWSEKVFYITTMQVPEGWDNNDIEDAFWKMDLSGEKIIDSDFAKVEDIEVTE